MTILGIAKAWVILVPAMIANGIFRELVLRRVVGPAAAEALSAALGIAIIVVLTRHLLRPLAGASPQSLVLASLELVLLTVAFEFLFGHYVEGESWSELAGNYAIWRGRLWPVVLASLAFMPFLWGRWSLRRPSHAR
jgi:hypothetical protein